MQKVIPPLKEYIKEKISPFSDLYRSQTPLPPTPGASQELVAQATPNISQTGLTQTETALLSNEEKAMRLRQRGMA